MESCPTFIDWSTWAYKKELFRIIMSQSAWYPIGLIPPTGTLYLNNLHDQVKCTYLPHRKNIFIWSWQIGTFYLVVNAARLSKKIVTNNRQKFVQCVATTSRNMLQCLSSFCLENRQPQTVGIWFCLLHSNTDCSTANLSNNCGRKKVNQQVQGFCEWWRQIKGDWVGSRV